MIVNKKLHCFMKYLKFKRFCCKVWNENMQILHDIEASLLTKLCPSPLTGSLYHSNKEYSDVLRFLKSRAGLVLVMCYRKFQYDPPIISAISSTVNSLKKTDTFSMTTVKLCGGVRLTDFTLIADFLLNMAGG